MNGVACPFESHKIEQSPQDKGTLPSGGDEAPALVWPQPDGRALLLTRAALTASMSFRAACHSGGSGHLSHGRHGCWLVAPCMSSVGLLDLFSSFYIKLIGFCFSGLPVLRGRCRRLRRAVPLAPRVRACRLSSACSSELTVPICRSGPRDGLSLRC